MSDKKQFPSFLRTYHSEIYWATAFALLVKHFGWKYVGIVAIEDAYIADPIANFLADVEPAGICIAFQEILPQHYKEKHLEYTGKAYVRILDASIT